MRKGGKREFGQRKKGSVLQYRAPVTRRASGESAPHLRGRQFFLRVRDNAATLFHLGCRHCPTCVGLGVVLGVSPVHLTPHRKTGLYLFARRRWLWCVPWLLVNKSRRSWFHPNERLQLCMCVRRSVLCVTLPVPAVTLVCCVGRGKNPRFAAKGCILANLTQKGRIRGRMSSQVGDSLHRMKRGTTTFPVKILGKCWTNISGFEKTRID